VILVLALLLAGAFIALVVAARRARRRWVSFVLALVAAVIAPPLLLLAAVTVAHVRNDQRLARFAAQLDRFPAPAGARVVHRLAAVGILTGNGDHCDFLARHEIASTQPIERIRAHYARLLLRPAIDGGADGGLPDLSVAPRAGGGYVVTAIDAPYGAGLDERCH
jgi:hypothetical protein